MLLLSSLCKSRWGLLVALMVLNPFPLAVAEPAGLKLELTQTTVAVDQIPVPISVVRVTGSNIASHLKPFWSDSTQLVGLAELNRSAQEQGALTAINAGFFNRNTQQPIGAIRVAGEWISSPVLGRGVIAWDTTGAIYFDRVRSRGFLQTQRGLELPLNGINTAYIVPGISQYTSAWGSTYTTQADHETVIEVKQNQITQIEAGGTAGSLTRLIPTDGYLLTGRPLNNNSDSQALMVGDQLNLSLALDPIELDHYPYMLGAGPLLLKNGAIVLDAELEGFQPSFRNQRAARSVICQTSSSEILMITVGQAQELTGVSLLKMAQLSQDLGCIQALNLDGGSSSSLYYQGKTVNLPTTTRFIPRVHNGLGIFP